MDAWSDRKNIYIKKRKTKHYAFEYVQQKCKNAKQPHQCFWIQDLLIDFTHCTEMNENQWMLGRVGNIHPQI